MKNLYRIQYKAPGQPWQRYCPNERWRWVRPVD
jgi:hypothetical protein